MLAYNVYRSVDGVRESLGSVSASTTSFTDAAIDPEASYVYYVTAASTKGESAPSNLAFTDYPRCHDIVDPIALVFDQEVHYELGCVLPPPTFDMVRIIIGD